jgi:hypothetical protein
MDPRFLVDIGPSSVQERLRYLGPNSKYPIFLLQDVLEYLGQKSEFQTLQEELKYLGQNLKFPMLLEKLLFLGPNLKYQKYRLDALEYRGPKSKLQMVLEELEFLGVNLKYRMELEEHEFRGLNLKFLTQSGGQEYLGRNWMYPIYAVQESLGRNLKLQARSGEL